MRFDQGSSAARAVGRWLRARSSVERAAAVVAGGLLLAVGSWVVAPNAPVCAGCGASPGNVIWTWPAPGATDVNPAEGLSVMAREGYGFTRVEDESQGFEIRLNGEVLLMDPQEHIFGPFPLEPETDYEFVVQLIARPDYLMTFRTGATRPLASALPAPEIVSLGTRSFLGPGESDVLSRSCRPAFSLTDCFDNGLPDLVEITLARDSRRPWPDDALIFHTREVRDLPPYGRLSETWLPGSVCQPLNVHDIEDEPACAQVRYRTPDGRYSGWSAPFCEGDDESGCAARSNSPGSSLPGVLAIVAALLIARRREGRG
jgi:hypothetical protein